MSTALLCAAILLGTACQVTGLTFVTKVEGPSATLSCEGSPGIKILFITDPTGKSYRNPHPNRGFDIHIRHVIPKYEGTWACTAKSPFVTATAKTSVRGPSQSVIARMGYKGPSSLKEALQLDCKVSGADSVVVNWYKDGSVLSNSRAATSSSRRSDGLVHNLLTIQHPIRSDAGTYRCVVLSGSKNATASADVFFSDNEPVVGKPDPQPMEPNPDDVDWW